MARSLRSSTKKSNRAKLRKKVFGPVEQARTERLSNKLLELSFQPRPKAREDLGDRADKDVDNRSMDDQAGPTTSISLPMKPEMELDGISATTKAVIQPSSKSKHIPKRRRGKANATMVFPVRQKGKRVELRRRTRKCSTLPT